MVDAKTGQLGHVGIAITFALVIMFGFYAVGHISGAHFNAAVTFADGQAFLWELGISAFLMFLILAVATDTRAVGEAPAIAIGGTIGLDAMFGGPITGASMNPIRSLAPAIVSGDVHALWVYLTAPVLGASLGGLAYQFVRGEQTRSRELPEVEDASEEAA